MNFEEDAIKVIKKTSVYYEALRRTWAANGGKILGKGGVTVGGNLDTLAEEAAEAHLALIAKYPERFA